ncbi:MAG: hypothetical protein KIT31_02015 [Deltaproteobacteria bacterium]|nr:hypothetical protein [Deltaproteobacteria bacterium]
MSSIFADGALHPGRDANDASWVILRSPHDWRTAEFRDAAYDAGRRVIELAPRALDGEGPCEVVADDGTTYRSDPGADRVLRRGPCDRDFVPLAGIGGRGTTTGRLRRPRGLALDDRGLLYIADSDNHRIQVVRPRDGSVVIVLGCADAWGEPVAGVDGGAMTEPVAVAVAATAIYVADRMAGCVHVFDRSFRWLRTTASTPAPVAVGVTAANELLVADAALSSLLRFTPDGIPLAGVAFDDPCVPESLAPLAAAARFAARGEVLVGPIDGALDDLAWHRVIVDAQLPPGTRVEVQTFAGAEIVPPAPVPWAPVVPVPIDARDASRDGEAQRPVLSDTGRWQRARHGDYRRGAPVIATYRGDGPSGVAELLLRGTGLARIRTGDIVELSTDRPVPAVERATVGEVPTRMVTIAARGDLTAPYDAGTRVTLRLRGGHEPFAGPRTLYELAGTEVIDLTTVEDDGSLFELALPHAAAALMRSGDVIELLAGPRHATIVVDGIANDPVVVPLLAAPGADLRHATVRIVETADRLFVRDGEGLDEHVPPGEPITVFGIEGGVAFETAAAIRWVEPELGVVWLAPGSTIAGWERFTTVAARATDRGRYLWLRLHLIGATAHDDDDRATASPTIRSVRLLRPRLSYLRYLPGTYARRDDDDPTGAIFLERMLAMFEHELTRIEGRYESVARQVDPRAADPEWLRFLAAWFDLYLDPALPLERRRLLVAEVHTLYARRGTPEGIRRYLEIITGRAPSIVEGQQLRPSSRIILGCSGVIGCSSLGGTDDEVGGSAFLDSFAHRATIYAFVDDPCDREQVEASLRRVLGSIVPAHVAIDLHVVTPDARVGWQSTVGIDLVLGEHRAGRPDPVLGFDSVLTLE